MEPLRKKKKKRGKERREGLSPQQHSDIKQYTDGERLQGP